MLSLFLPGRSRPLPSLHPGWIALPIHSSFGLNLSAWACLLLTCSQWLRLIWLGLTIILIIGSFLRSLWPCWDLPPPLLGPAREGIVMLSLLLWTLLPRLAVGMELNRESRPGLRVVSPLSSCLKSRWPSYVTRESSLRTPCRSVLARLSSPLPDLIREWPALRRLVTRLRRSSTTRLTALR